MTDLEAIEIIEREALDPEYDAWEEAERLQDIADERAIQRMEERRQG